MHNFFRGVTALLIAAAVPLSGSQTASEADRAQAVAFVRSTLNRGVAEQHPAEQHPWCETSEVNTERQKALARWVAAKQHAEKKRRGMAPDSLGGSVRFENKMFVMQSDPTILPFDRPVDLQNSSIYFARAGTDGFDVQKTALPYDDAVTPWVSLDLPPTHAVRALSFNFPFYGTTYNTVYVSSTKGIYFSTPPATDFLQYDPMQAVQQRIPVIAPLLETTMKNWRPYDVLVREVAGVSITFNWRSEFGDDFDQDIQVTLFSSGDIRFSYKTVKKGAMGVVLVTSGSEPFYSARTPVMSAPDASGDVDVLVPPAIRPMLDVQTMQFQRVGNSDLLEFQLTLGASFNPAALSPGSEVYFFFTLGATTEERNPNFVYTIVDSSGNIRHFYPGGTWMTNPPGVTIDGNVVKIQILEDSLALGTLQTQLEVFTSYSEANYQGDLANASFTMNVPGVTVATDMSSLAPARRLKGPVLELFTLPALNVYGVWERLKTVYGLTDDEIDQVAIYQNLYTDIIFSAGAFSTSGNSGDDGVRWDFSGSTQPRQPALLHMNTLGYGWNSWPEGILAVRTHEFGHRWLYFTRIMENGVATNSLNPDGAHPKRGVHIPAAFPTITATDSSAMGGGYFTQVGPSSYQTAPVSTYYGFSWHELYLMGLADAAEVPGWYYLSGEGLESAYYPNPGYTYSVTARTNVNQQQILDAMGPRNPSYATSRKVFQEAVVLIERASDPIPPASLPSISSQLVDGFSNHFSAITNLRGSVAAVTPSLYQPAGLTATATSPTNVLVSWSSVPAAGSYQVWRSSANGAFAQVGTTASTSFNDAVSASTTYLYKVRSVYSGANLSAFSATDLATTVMFTDDPLLPSATRVKAVHLTELRAAVNAVRAAAGLASATFTDPAPASIPVQAQHITEIKAAINAALALLGSPLAGGTVVSGGTALVKAADFQQIRDLAR